MGIILIVDDEQAVQRLLESLLTPQHQVMLAANATQAIESARLNRPDLVLLDLNLESRHDGLEVCRTLRNQSDPVLAQVPIVMLTVETNKADIKAALSAGANSYIGKPYRPSALLMVVNALLNK